MKSRVAEPPLSIKEGNQAWEGKLRRRDTYGWSNGHLRFEQFGKYLHLVDGPTVKLQSALG